MGWTAVRRIIAGYFATAASGPRVVIDGLGGTLGQIEWFSADGAEVGAAAIHIIPFAPGLAYLKILAPTFSGQTPARAELWTDGTFKLFASNKVIIDHDALMEHGSLTIAEGNASITAGVLNIGNRTGAAANIGGDLNVNNGGSVAVGTGNVNLTAGVLNIGFRTGTAANIGGDVNVNNNGNVYVNGGNVTLSNGNLTVSNGNITLGQGRVIRGGAWALTATPGGLLNGWTNYGAPYETAAVIQYPDYTAGYVGVVQAGTTAGGTTIHNLPSYLRPAGYHVFSCATSGGGQIQMVVRSDGDLRIQSGFTSGTWIALSTMRWPISGFG